MCISIDYQFDKGIFTIKIVVVVNWKILSNGRIFISVMLK